MTLSYLDLISDDFSIHTQSIIASDHEIITYFMGDRNKKIINRYKIINEKEYTWKDDIQLNGSGNSIKSKDFIL